MEGEEASGTPNIGPIVPYSRYYDSVPSLGEARARLLAMDDDGADGEGSSWRSKEKQKSKTFTLGLIMCLNIGVVPPDVIKTNPCAKLEAWIDPTSMTTTKAMEAISAKLTAQYLRWQPKAKFRQAPDPTLDEVKRLCMALRRRAKDESVLLHFNGHGVPRPTTNGELWVFNKNFTQYLPASIYDIQTWVGSPTIFVYDCSGAGVVVDSFRHFALKREREYKRKAARLGSLRQVAQPLKECMQLAACRQHETLPTDPAYPADLFTACLTTPIEMALRWVFTTRQKHMLPGVTMEMIENIPGTVSDRSTMRGQLNWIFTAITDTISWNILPADLFHRIFRNDLLVAALFRNFLLAERIMRGVNCTPVSDPALPPAYDHPLWEAWDMAVDYCLAQLPGVFNDNEEFRSCPFFDDQVWLDMSGNNTEDPPEQLPIVLQVLLSQTHRLRALQLLDRFLGMGPWAVQKSLSVGIFPYVLKLLGAQAVNLRPVLISIWAKIVAVDPSCRQDLLKPTASVAKKSGGNQPQERPKGGYAYFIRALANPAYDEEMHGISTFVLTVFLDNNRQGQSYCVATGLLDTCVAHLSTASPSSQLRLWLCLALCKLWDSHPEAQETALRTDALGILLSYLRDPLPKVRAAALQALGALLGPRPGTPKDIEIDINVHRIGLSLAALAEDGSHAVRTELAAALSPLVVMYKPYFQSVAAKAKEEERLQKSRRDAQQDPFARLLKVMFALAADPFPTVAEIASVLLGHLGIRTGSRRRTTSRNRADTSDSSAPPTPTQASSSSAINVAARQPMPGTPGGLGGTPPTPALGSFEMGISGSYASPALGWCRDYVRVASGDYNGQRASSESDALESLLTVLSHAIGVMQAREHGTATAEQVNLAQINSCVSGALEAVPGLKASMQGVGWQGTRFANSLSSALLQRAHEVTRAYLIDISDSGQANRLRLCQTHFFDWCVSTFHAWTQAGDSNPFQEAEALEWMHERETLALEGARALASMRPSTLKLSEPVFHKPFSEVVNLLRFHPYEQRLVSCSTESGTVTVHDTIVVDSRSSFHSGVAKPHRLTNCQIVNEQRDSLLMLGSSDGVVRLWRDYDSAAPTLTTAWRVVQKMRASQSGQGAGLVLSWHQLTGHLLASGDVPYIQVWDGPSELRVRRIPTMINSCITSMAYDQSGAIVSAGYGNGIVRLYDLRCSDDRAMTQHYDHHKSWVVNVHMQKEGRPQIISGSKRGDLLWWDPRFPGEPTRRVQAHKLRADDSMTAFEVHDYAPILATASPNSCIKMFSLEGDPIHQYKHYNSFLGEAIGPTAALSFHPFKPLLAASSFEKTMSIYGAPGTQP